MNKALTNDTGKPPLAHLPWAAMDMIAEVQSYGHRKYGDFYNYRKGMEVSRNLSCALRHIRDYMNGHDVDHESGLNPLGHALCRLAFVVQNLHDGTATDDRFKRPQSELERALNRIAQLEDTLETVCCGTGITCTRCGRTKPCNCECETTPAVHTSTGEPSDSIPS